MENTSQPDAGNNERTALTGRRCTTSSSGIIAFLRQTRDDTTGKRAFSRAGRGTYERAAATAMSLLAYINNIGPPESCQIERGQSCALIPRRYLVMAGRYILLLISSCAVPCILSAPGRPIYLGYQDSIGQYSFGYSSPTSARSEVRTSDGVTRGSYSYVDETGTIHKAEYIADAQNGFRIIATNLPQPPLPVEDTSEVTAARAAHLQALEMAVRQAEQTGSSEDQKHSETPRNAANHIGIISGIVGSSNIAPNRNYENSTVVQSELKQTQNGSEVYVSRNNATEQRGSKGNSEVAQISEKRVDDRTATSEVIDSVKIQSIMTKPQGFEKNWITSGQSVSVYEILPGSLEIRASGIQRSSIAQGAPAAVDSPNTKLGTQAHNVEGMKMQVMTAELEKQTKLQSSVPGNALNSAFTSVHIVPLTSYSSFLGYPQYFPYVSYGIL